MYGYMWRWPVTIHWGYTCLRKGSQDLLLSGTMELGGTFTTNACIWPTTALIRRAQNMWGCTCWCTHVVLYVASILNQYVHCHDLLLSSYCLVHFLLSYYKLTYPYVLFLCETTYFPNQRYILYAINFGFVPSFQYNLKLEHSVTAYTCCKHCSGVRILL